MKLHPYSQILLLIIALNATAAFKFRCWLFCTDQTGIQTDYIDARDSCRKYAQLRIDTDTANPELMDDKNRRNKLVSLFSSCMADRGWTVPDGKSGQQPAAPIPVPTPGANTAQSSQAGAPPVAAPVQTEAPAAIATPIANPSPAIITADQARVMNDQRREKNYLARQSECAFARHGAPYSSVSATRAKACDIECEQSRKANEGGKLPAACPPDPYETNNRQ